MKEKISNKDGGFSCLCNYFPARRWNGLSVCAANQKEIIVGGACGFCRKWKIKAWWIAILFSLQRSLLLLRSRGARKWSTVLMWLQNERTSMNWKTFHQPFKLLSINSWARFIQACSVARGLSCTFYKCIVGIIILHNTAKQIALGWMALSALGLSCTPGNAICIWEELKITRKFLYVCIRKIEPDTKAAPREHPGNEKYENSCRSSYFARSSSASIKTLLFVR